MSAEEDRLGLLYVLKERMDSQSEQLREIRASLRQLNIEFDEWKHEQIGRERQMYKWGIGTLGGAILALGGILWKYLGMIVNGPPPGN